MTSAPLPYRCSLQHAKTGALTTPSQIELPLCLLFSHLPALICFRCQAISRTFVDSSLTTALVIFGVLSMLLPWLTALGLNYASVGQIAPFRYTAVIFAGLAISGTADKLQDCLPGSLKCAITVATG